MAGGELKPDVQEMLRDYLQEQRKGPSVADIMRAVSKVVDELATQEERNKDREKLAIRRHEELSDVVKGVSARVTALEKNADDSGTHTRAKLDSFNADLDEVEQTVAAVRSAAEVKYDALKSEILAEKKAREEAEVKQKEAELARYQADEKERKTRAKGIVDKVATAAITTVVLAMLSGLGYLISQGGFGHH